jgi:hypothetical protein
MNKNSQKQAVNTVKNKKCCGGKKCLSRAMKAKPDPKKSFWRKLLETLGLWR